MFDLPSINGKTDAESIRRYLMRLVPQIENELYNLTTDNFSSAYNERLAGLTNGSVTDENGKAATNTTTAEAIAAHMQSKNNPHGVTAEQAGLQYWTAKVGLTWTENEDGTIAQEIDVSGMTENSRPVVSLLLSDTPTTWDAEENAFAQVRRVDTMNEKIRVYVKAQTQTQFTLGLWGA